MENYIAPTTQRQGATGLCYSPPNRYFHKINLGEDAMLVIICNRWKSCYHQRQLMQIFVVTIDGALSQPA